MDQFRDLADDRLLVGCIYCSAFANTRDHVPSKVLLDAPLPENLPVVGACWGCNKGFSSDEEYFACLIESVVSGSTDPEGKRRPGIAKILRHSPALRNRIEAAKVVENGQVRFEVEPDRLRNVVLKLARGHAAYELSQPCREAPTSLWWGPLSSMTADDREAFDAPEVIEVLAEVGSRAMQRILVVQLTLQAPEGSKNLANMFLNDWIDVQEGRYRYHASDSAGEITVKIVIGDYLACQVSWAKN